MEINTAKGCMRCIAEELGDRQCPSLALGPGANHESSVSGCLLASIEADMSLWSSS